MVEEAQNDRRHEIASEFDKLYREARDYAPAGPAKKDDMEP